MTEREYLQRVEMARRGYYRALGETVVGALNKRGYRAFYCDSKEEARAKVLEIVPQGVSVGIPGTVTVLELGLMEALSARGNRVVEHTLSVFSDPGERARRLLEERDAQFYIAGCNALTYDGVLVNIDGTGNRVAQMAWSTVPILYVAGVNKVVRDVEAAIDRVRDVATPMNALRLGYAIPCARVGYCIRCGSPDCICRKTLVVEWPQKGRDEYFVLVGEILGF